LKVGKKEYVADLREFIKEFVASQDAVFKSKLIYNGETLYLLPLTPHENVYLFVQSRDKEIIKAIEKSSLSVQAIQKKLLGNESIGFASYVLIDAHWVGVACRVLSPRINAFAHFMTQIFTEIGKSIVFTPVALTDSLPKKEVAKLKHVGAVCVEMDMSNTVCQEILGTVTGIATANLMNIANVEIRITPQRKGKKSLENVLKGMLKSLPTDGLESLEARGKLETMDRITDMFIVGQGGLRDFIPDIEEADVPTTLKTLAAANQKLQGKASAFAGAKHYEKCVDISTLGITGKFPSHRGVSVVKKRG
jgi:hypothetical protein